MNALSSVLLTEARKLRTRPAQRLFHRLRHVFFQRAVVDSGISVCEHRRRFACTSGEDCKDCSSQDGRLGQM